MTGKKAGIIRLKRCEKEVARLKEEAKQEGKNRGGKFSVSAAGKKSDGFGSFPCFHFVICMRRDNNGSHKERSDSKKRK